MAFSRFNTKGSHGEPSTFAPSYHGDRIFGDKIGELFEHLRKDRRLIKLNLPGKGGYERLTIVTEVVREEDIPCFVIDCPAGFHEWIRDAEIQEFENLTMFFEFVGPDHIPYAFKSTPVRTDRRDIRVKIPRSVERIQRRGHFRIEPPSGTVITFFRDTGRCKNSVLNLSLSGALISPRKTPLPGLRPSPGEQLHDIKLIVKKRPFKIQINIKKAVVGRLGKDAAAAMEYYALRFLEMEKEEERTLEQWLIQWQREVLRRRSRLAG
ncbi:MAG: PilZ domain-containing protein [Desulfatiglandales bacterium]